MEKRNSCRILVRKQKVRDHWEHQDVGGCTILKWMEWDGMDWSDLAQDRDQWRAVVETVMNLRVQYNAGKFLSSSKIGGFSRRAQLHE
jgi:hypothetical protein